MSSLRDVNNNDILKKWYIGMEEMYLGIMNEQDKENDLETDELFDKLLNSIPKNNRKFVQNQLELIEKILKKICGSVILKCLLLISSRKGDINEKIWFSSYCNGCSSFTW